MAELPLSVPLDMAIRERVRSSAFGRDLQTLLQLAEDKLGAALAVLASAEGFVGPRRLPVLLQGGN